MPSGSTWAALALVLAGCGDDEALQQDDLRADAPADADDHSSEPGFERALAIRPESGASATCREVQTAFIDCGLGSLVGNGSLSCAEVESPAVDPCQSDCLARADCAELSELLCHQISSAAIEQCVADCAERNRFSCDAPIPSGWVCDGEADCRDGSDEEQDCPQPFVCGNGIEYPASFECDGFIDCVGAEDELDCEIFECTGGDVIVARWVCDAYPDCEGGEDEVDCDYPFVCDSGEPLPEVLVCDGYPQCPDGSDEHEDCTEFVCEVELGPSALCSGTVECSDGSDEPDDCESTFLFTCGSEEVIPLEWRCDAKADCLDASDELDCPAPATFTCDDGTVLLQSDECDRYVDCFDASDEHDGCWYRLVCR